MSIGYAQNGFLGKVEQTFKQMEWIGENIDL
jgi:hypothetical protein